MFRGMSGVPGYGHVHVGARCGVDARIAPPFMEATDASRLVCVVVVSYQEYSLTHDTGANWRVLALSHRSRLSDSVKNGNALSSVHNAAVPAR